MEIDRLWTARELAKVLQYSESTVARLVSQEPHKLPPRVAGLSRPRWLPSVVMTWLQDSNAGAKRGRPRKN